MKKPGTDHKESKGPAFQNEMGVRFQRGRDLNRRESNYDSDLKWPIVGSEFQKIPTDDDRATEVFPHARNPLLISY